MNENHINRPAIHYSPRGNWMNDPNGCVYHDGTYHLFYQYNPHANSWGTIHWGHATSTDLLAWEEHEPALHPDARLGDVFSGSVVVDDQNSSGMFPKGCGLAACYTSHRHASGQGIALQQQCLAYSTENGMEWRTYPGNPIIANPGLADFRDPKVFYHQQSAAWVMVVSAGFELHVYRSHNLIDWEYTSAFGVDLWGKTHILECPDLFPLLSDQGKLHWVLVVSFFQTVTPRYAPVAYILGNFDGYVFTPKSEAVLFDFGGDFYAPQSWNGYRDAPATQVWIAWANNWAYANHIPTAPWRGVMSLPREIQLIERDGACVLVQKPVSSLEAYISSESDLPVDDGRREWMLDFATEKAHSLQLEVKDAELGSLQLVFHFGCDESLVVTWTGEVASIVVDRTHLKFSTFHEAYPGRMEASIPRREFLQLEIIIDVSIIEIFVNQGAQVLTCQIFPGAPLNHCICTLDGGLRLQKLQHVADRTIFRN
jgi:sucrose-6-phosphate hydrolase SacC (GH32 family)